MIAPVLDAQLGHAVGRGIDPRAHGITLGARTHQIELDPMVGIALVMEQIVRSTEIQRTQIEAIGDIQIQKTIHIVIGADHGISGTRATGHRNPNGPAGAAGIGHGDEGTIALVFVENILDIAGAGTAGQIQIEIHIVVKIARRRADALDRCSQSGRSVPSV